MLVVFGLTLSLDLELTTQTSVKQKFVGQPQQMTTAKRRDPPGDKNQKQESKVIN